MVAYNVRRDAGAGDWRVVGIASGTANWEEESQAAEAAAYAAWVMVEEGDRREYKSCESVPDVAITHWFEVG